MTAIWNFIMAHQTTASLVAYYIFGAAVGALPMPDTSSGKFYRFFFSFCNTIAANISRVSAVPSKTDAAPPKP